MKVLLWEMPGDFWNIVLWDGENTYWCDEMRPSSGYKEIKFKKVCNITNTRFVVIGEL